MSGRKSKDKGYRFENALRIVLNAFGPCERMPLSGAIGGDFSGDLRWLIRNVRMKIQCKKKARGFKLIYNELKSHDALIIGADREPPVLCIPLHKFAEIFLHEPEENPEAFRPLKGETEFRYWKRGIPVPPGWEDTGCLEETHHGQYSTLIRRVA